MYWRNSELVGETENGFGEMERRVPSPSSMTPDLVKRMGPLDAEEVDRDEDPPPLPLIPLRTFSAIFLAKPACPACASDASGERGDLAVDDPDFFRSIAPTPVSKSPTPSSVTNTLTMYHNQMFDKSYRQNPRRRVDPRKPD